MLRFQLYNIPTQHWSQHSVWKWIFVSTWGAGVRVGYGLGWGGLGAKLWQPVLKLQRGNFQVVWILKKQNMHGKYFWISFCYKVFLKLLFIYWCSFCYEAVFNCYLFIGVYYFLNFVCVCFGLTVVVSFCFDWLSEPFGQIL